jgi:hypothetical protein
MELRFASLNILDNKNIYGNIKSCDRNTSAYDKDNIFRYTIIANILTSNDYDILFLQEVGTLFNQPAIVELLKKKFEIFQGSQQNTQWTLINRNKIKNSERIYLSDRVNKHRFSSTINNAYLVVKGMLSNNKPIHLINMHLPIDMANRTNIFTIIKEYLREHITDSAIISGDMNADTTIDINPGTLIPLTITGFTSYSLIKCSNTGVPETKTKTHNLLDQILVTNNINFTNVDSYDDFDKTTFKLKSTNTFSTYGPPFCLTENNLSIQNCKVHPYEYVFANSNKKWVSDHILLNTILTINDTLPVVKVSSQLSVKSPEFKPGQLSAKSPEFRPSTLNKGGTPIDYAYKYHKYKTKYLQLKKMSNLY